MSATIAVPPPSYNEAITSTGSAAPQVAPYTSSVGWMKSFAAARENFKTSPLMRLPDNVLVNIMESTSSDCDTLALRHVSRTFMRLFSENETFLKLWEDGHAMEEGHVWTRPNQKYSGQGTPAVLCDHCDDVRDGDKIGKEVLQNMGSLYCSGCRTEHTAMHFSKIQREEIDEERVCIGRESRLRLCSHASICWSQVRVLANSGRENRFGCNHISHDGLPCIGKKCKLTSYPEVTIDLDEEDNYYIRIISRSHVAFNKGADGEKPFWANVLMGINDSQEAADKLQLLPSVKFEGCDVMRIFDPNHCNCLNWDVMSNEQVTAAATGCFKWRLANTDCGNWRGPCVAELDEYGGPLSIGTVDLPTDRCFDRRHGFTKRMNGRVIEIDLLRCADDANMLVLQQAVIIKVQDPTDPGWEELMDENMVFMHFDHDMRGKTWCVEKDCAVNYLNRSNRSLRVLEHVSHNGCASLDQDNTSSQTEDETSDDEVAEQAADVSDNEDELSDIDASDVDLADIEDAEVELRKIEDDEDELSDTEDYQSITTTGEVESIFTDESRSASPRDDESTTSEDDVFTDADSQLYDDARSHISEDMELLLRNDVTTHHSADPFGDGYADNHFSGLDQAGHQEASDATAPSYYTGAYPRSWSIFSGQLPMYYPEPDPAALASILLLWDELGTN